MLYKKYALDIYYRRYAADVCFLKKVQSTLVISNSKGLAETIRDIRTSTYQSWESEENNKLYNHI